MQLCSNHWKASINSTGLETSINSTGATDEVQLYSFNNTLHIFKPHIKDGNLTELGLNTTILLESLKHIT